MLIEDNKINGTTASGVLTAGRDAHRDQREIAFVGRRGASGAAMQIATPGMEWDNYAGVENMISSAILVANNVVDGWANAVQLDAARDVAIVYNTVADGVGLRLNHRTPHDQQRQRDPRREQRDPAVEQHPALDFDGSPEQRPAFESNNLVWQGGGGRWR